MCFICIISPVTETYILTVTNCLPYFVHKPPKLAVLSFFLYDLSLFPFFFLPWRNHKLSPGRLSCLGCIISLRFCWLFWVGLSAFLYWRSFLPISLGNNLIIIVISLKWPCLFLNVGKVQRLFIEWMTWLCLLPLYGFEAEIHCQAGWQKSYVSLLV